MAGESDIAYDYTTGGWTCALCGAFVGPGAYHDCEYNPSPPFLIDQGSEIVDLLKKIVELLEKE